jgi:hypothetical protein
MGDISNSPFPVCSICDKPVEFETSKTNELGKVVHDGCYLLRLNLKNATTLPKS